MWMAPQLSRIPRIYNEFRRPYHGQWQNPCHPKLAWTLESKRCSNLSRVCQFLPKIYSQSFGNYSPTNKAYMERANMGFQWRVPHGIQNTQTGIYKGTCPHTLETQSVNGHGDWCLRLHAGGNPVFIWCRRGSTPHCIPLLYHYWTQTQLWCAW